MFRKGDTIERPLQLVFPSETEQRKILLSLRRGGDSKLTLEARDQDELQLKGLTRELQNSWMQRSRMHKLDCRLHNGLSSS